MVLPRAPEEFHGRYSNKVALVDRLRFQWGYQFFTLLRGFTSHKYHTQRDGGEATNVESMKSHHKTMRDLRNKYREQYLDTMPPVRVSSPFDDGFIFNSDASM